MFNFISIFAKISVEKIAQNIQEGRMFTIYLYKKNFQKQGNPVTYLRTCHTYLLHMYYNKIRVKFSSSMNLAGDRTLTLWGVL